MKSGRVIGGGRANDSEGLRACRFGGRVAEKLTKIGIGGRNNQKGATFENYYAVAKICSLAANASSIAEMDDFLVSSQEEAFVDDLCVRRTSVGGKINYQAKNSSGAAADWDEDMQTRFQWQRKIDLDFHGSSSSEQVLLVSCAKKAAANDGKIPVDMKDFCRSEHFPYSPSLYELLRESNALREDLAKLCTSGSLSVIDCAFRLVLGVWSEGGEKPRSVGDMIGQAKAMARPDIFAGHIAQRSGVPGWIREKCAAFPQCSARVEFGNFIVSYNGIEATLGSNPVEPDAKTLEALQTAQDFLMFLMSMAAEELNA